MRDGSKGRQNEGISTGRCTNSGHQKLNRKGTLDLELTHVAFLRTRAFFWFLCFPKIPTSYFPQRPFFFFADQGLTQASCGVSTVRRACHTAELHLIDPVSMGAVRPPRRQGSARRPLRPGRYGAMKSKILGTWEGQKKRTLGGCMGRRQSPNGGRRGL